jgi:hypothetical protein
MRAFLNSSAAGGKALRMSDARNTKLSPAASREERLAAKLRENLRRRKAQSREMRESGVTDLSKSEKPG